MINRLQSVRQSQRGITLIICMIVLLVLTFMGLASIQDTTLEERMAGNLRNSNLAFQAAESALRNAEDRIAGMVLMPDFDGSTLGLYPALSVDSANWSYANWLASGAAYSGPAIPGLAAPPRYYIEEMSTSEAEGTLQTGSVIEVTGMFRITAMGVGGSDTAVAVLQVYYKR